MTLTKLPPQVLDKSSKGEEKICNIWWLTNRYFGSMKWRHRLTTHLVSVVSFSTQVLFFCPPQNAIIGAVWNIILCIIDNSLPSISVAWVAGIWMGKEKEVSGAEECTHGRREGKGTPTSIAGGWGGGGGLRNKIQEQKNTTSRAAIKRWGREFSQATFIGKQKKNITKNGPGYVANLFKPWVTPYNLGSNGLNVVQTSYAYMISHIWNQLPSAVKNAPNASSFRRLLTKLNFIGCQCSNCLWPDLFL